MLTFLTQGAAGRLSYYGVASSQTAL